MKIIFALVASLMAFSAAHAEDHKVGNVIAVQRDINNLYDTCVKNVVGDVSKTQNSFFCNIKFIKSPTEIPVSRGGVIRFQDDRCQVFGDVEGGFLMIGFGKAQGASSFEQAKVCLQRSLQGRDSTAVLVYTLDQQ